MISKFVIKLLQVTQKLAHPTLSSPNLPLIQKYLTMKTKRVNLIRILSRKIILFQLIVTLMMMRALILRVKLKMKIGFL